MHGNVSCFLIEILLAIQLHKLLSMVLQNQLLSTISFSPSKLCSSIFLKPCKSETLTVCTCWNVPQHMTEKKKYLLQIINPWFPPNESKLGNLFDSNFHVQPSLNAQYLLLWLTFLNSFVEVCFSEVSVSHHHSFLHQKEFVTSLPPEEMRAPVF